jgi:large subunit ribosomal protein L25
VKSVLKSEKGENTVLRIHRGDIDVDAMLHDIQYDCLTDRIIHVDLLRIDIKKPVIVHVPIKVKGQAVGVKVEDGIFEFITREVKVKCLVTQIPNDFVIDITGLHIGQSLKAEDLDIEEGIQLLYDPHTMICAVNAKTKAEVVEEVEEEVEAAAAEEEAGDKEETKDTED